MTDTQAPADIAASELKVGDIVAGRIVGAIAANADGELVVRYVAPVHFAVGKVDPTSGLEVAAIDGEGDQVTVTFWAARSVFPTDATLPADSIERRAQ